MDEVLAEIYPGPLDDFVLTEQEEHRSSVVWQGEDEETHEKAMYVRHDDGTFWEGYQIAPRRVKDYIDLAGFGGVARLGRILIDEALLTALVERWRPETHTFHFVGGEATITLQDVAILWGLPVDGQAITGPRCDYTKQEWQVTCERLLGYRPIDAEITGNMLNITTLLDIVMTPLDEHVDDVLHAQRARCLILILMTDVIFTNHLWDEVHMRYLLLLEDLKKAGTYSWGSGVLAYCYRCLCDGTDPRARVLVGPLVLVQLWAWERLPMVRPVISAIPHLIIPEQAPYGARWHIGFDLYRLATYVLLVYRVRLDTMSSDQFVWTPYDTTMQTLDPKYLEGEDIWRAEVPLICWEIVEHYWPRRVMRQFRLEQLIPPHVQYDRVLHCMSLHGHVGMNWETHHHMYIVRWDDRHNSVVIGEVAQELRNARPDYMQWYHRITRILISNPEHRRTYPQSFESLGPNSQLLVSTAVSTMEMAEIGEQLTQDEDVQDMLERIRDMLTSVLREVEPMLSSEA